jgi:hypothetical protein
MHADSRSSRRGTCRKRTKCGWHSEKVNRLSWLAVDRDYFSTFLIVSLILALASSTAVGQTADPNRRLLIHGLIVTASAGLQSAFLQVLCQRVDIEGISQRDRSLTCHLNADKVKP